MRLLATRFDMTAEKIEQFIMENMEFQDRVIYGMDALCELYAKNTVNYAKKRSYGPLDPTGKTESLAWLIPVRRIKGTYYDGWYAKQLGMARWLVSNTSREAYFIEFGINHQGITGKKDIKGQRVRIRRPILKLSLMDAVAGEAKQLSGMVGNAWVSVGGVGGFMSVGSPALTGGTLYTAGRIPSVFSAASDL